MTNLKTLINEADAARNSAQTQRAIELYKQIFALAQEQNLHQEAGDALQMIGVTYKIDNNTEQSLEWLFKAFRYFAEHGILKGTGNVLRDVAITHEYVNDLVSAKTYLEAALAILSHSHDEVGYAITATKLAKVHIRESNLEEAKPLLDESLHLLQNSPQEWFFYGTTLLHFAQLQIAQADYKAAVITLLECEDVFQAHADEEQSRRLAQIWLSRAHCLAKLGTDRAEAINLVEKGTKVLDGFENESAREVVRNETHLSETKHLLGL
jgi:tetratricopeptide (TPR) repeat protein